MEHQASIVIILVVCVAAWQAHAAVTCTSSGRFADPADPTCQNYTYCIYNASTSSFLPYNYVCPSTSVFNPNTGKCTSPTAYTCPAIAVTTPAPAASLCTAEGLIPDPNSTDCSSYIMCVDLLGNGVFLETVMACPGTSFFNPNSTDCETNYVCTTFACTASGRFADTTDATCQSYHYCVLAADGTFLEYNYVCPSTSAFNPITRLCSGTYICRPVFSR